MILNGRQATLFLAASVATVIGSYGSMYFILFKL